MRRETDKLPAPTLDWPQGQAISRDYADPYFSRDDGLAESRHVFLEHNELPRRLGTARHLCIGELGFGTGLNFLLSWQLWQQLAPPGAQLDYVAVEAAPLRAGQMRRALAPWPELRPQLERLCRTLPEPRPGFHALEPAPGLRLLLLYGDVEAVLPQLRAQIDAWYLDGFAPARNPAMWSDTTLREVARLTRPGGSFATYSAAGRVRRALQTLGFAVRRPPGFGRKRSMLAGRLEQAAAISDRQPWLQFPAAAEGEITVLGDGLAGACLARQLAEDGRQVTVIGRGDGASHRIPGFLVRPYPEATASAAERLYAQAFDQAATFYERLAPDAARRIALQAGTSALPATVLRPATAIRALLDHPRIIYRRQDISGLAREEGIWRLALRDGGTVATPGPLLLCGAEAPAGLALALPLRPCAGQVAVIESRLEPAFADSVHGFALNGRSQIGSSYRQDERALDVRDSETEDLLARACSVNPTLTPGVRAVASHTGLRIGSRDHLPVIGPAPDLPRWAIDYAELHHGRPGAAYPPATCLPGLWLNLAHGSRGATLAPLAALLLAAALQQRPLPVPADLLAALHPGRFALRALRRGRDPRNKQAPDPAL